MKNTVLPRCTAGLGVAFALAVAEPAALAFGGAGNLGECTSFATCTAGVYSSVVSQTRYTVNGAGPAFPLGPLVPGVNTFTDSDARASTTPASAPSTPCFPACANTNPWPTSSSARSQSDFGLNRARAATGPGGGGTDERGGSLVAQVTIQTLAEANSAWRDVWSFSGSGHFSAPVALDGHARTTTQTGWPSSFEHTLASSTGEWFYHLRVWDTRPLGEDSDGFPAPLLVAELRAQAANEQRADFAFASALDFDFEAGVSYVAIGELVVKAGNGREIDLYDTARIGQVVLSAGTTMQALSGHDYVSTAVPEPQTAALCIGGLVLVAGALRRHRPHARRQAAA